MSNFPTVRIFIRCVNPKWKGEGNGWADTADGEPYFVTHETDAEILTLHLKTRKMRIRYKDARGRVNTKDISIDAFYQKYEINEINC